MTAQFAKEYDDIFREYFDITNDEDRSTYVSLEEDAKSQLILDLTSKLYDKIVEKVDDIDCATIAASRGDITKIENYDSMMECLDIINGILKQYGQETEPVDTVYQAIENIKSRERLFSKAFAVGAELPVVLYNTIVLAIVSSISFLIATCIEFIKSPNDDTFIVSFDKVAYKKTSQNLLFDNLRRFNRACVSKDFDDALEATIKGSVNTKNLTGTTVLTTVVSISIILMLSKQIIPLLQELVYFFYHSRQSISDYFAIQADLIQLNTANIVYKDLTEVEKKNIIKKQTKIADKFRKISNFFDIEYKTAEKKSKKLATDEKKKYKIADVSDAQPDGASSLF